MKIKILGGLLVALLAVTSVAQAQTRVPHANQRQRIQREQIRTGIRHGEIDRREANHLRRQSFRLHRAEQFARRDGYVSARERQHLRRQHNRFSMQIERAKHNRRYY